MRCRDLPGEAPRCLQLFFRNVDAGHCSAAACHPRRDVGCAAAELDGETESRLLEMWREMLDAGPIGVEDDFFEIGGHSLLGLRLITRIEKTFDRRLPLAALFETPCSHS